MAKLREHEELITLAEAAELLGASYWTAYRLVREGRLAASQIGSITVVRRSDVAALKESREKNPPRRGRKRREHTRV